MRSKGVHRPDENPEDANNPPNLDSNVIKPLHPEVVEEIKKNFEEFARKEKERKQKLFDESRCTCCPVHTDKRFGN